MDVSVQAEKRLRLFDDLADRGAARRNLVWPPPLGDVAQLLIDLVSGVEAALVRGDGDVEDGAARLLQLLGQGVRLE